VPRHHETVRCDVEVGGFCRGQDLRLQADQYRLDEVGLRGRHDSGERGWIAWMNHRRDDRRQRGAVFERTAIAVVATQLHLR
jgi:hypothetical protein